jgi:fibronectin-binding autotransporter adhesin
MKQTLCCLSLAILMAASPAQAATRTWLSSVGGLWTSNANWLDGIQPGASDTADLSAATGTIDLTADVTVGEILYNPTLVGGTTNTLTILSDTVAPSSRTITLTTTATRRIQVGTGAELQLDTDFKPTGALLKDGYGTLVLKRRLPGTVRTDFLIEQGRFVNEGDIVLYGSRMHLGTVEPETGDAPEFVMREGSSYVSTLWTQGSDLLWGGNRLLGSGTGSRAVVTHEGGTLDLSINFSGGIFLNAYAAGGSCVYNLSGGEVNLSGKGVWVSFNGTGTINQSGGKLKAGYLNFSNASTGSGIYNLTGGELWLGGANPNDGVAQKGGGTAALNIGGACIYPMGSGFNIYDNTHPVLTGINGPTRFCSTGSGFTSSLSGLTGPGGIVKEGADTLNIAGSAHSFTGPVTVTNGTLNVNQTMTGGNAVLVAGGSMNLGAVAVKDSSLMVTGGVFQVAAGSTLTLSGNTPVLQVAGTGTVKLLDGATLPGMTGLSVAESGGIDLSAGGTATVYRLILDGVEQASGYYTSGNCAAITGSGTLAVNTGAWTGAGGDMQWSTSSNWLSGTVPTGFSSIADLSASVSNEVPVGTLVFDLGAVTNNMLIFDSGVAGAFLTNTCPAGITNTLYMQASGIVYVGAGETLVLDHDLCLMGNLDKRGEGTLVLCRRTFALNPTSGINLRVEAGRVICCGAMTNVLVMVGKPERSVPGVIPEFILEDTPEASVSGNSFISAMSYLPTSLNPGSGIFTQNGGIVAPGISWQTKSQIGFSASGAAWGATGTYNLVSGSLRVEQNFVLAANAGVGVFNQSGGVADLDKLVVRIGKVSLTGGLFTLNEIDNTSASSCAFTMGGGRLEPKTTTPVSIWSAIDFTGENGNMTFAPEAGRAITLSGVTSGIGGFTKVDDGTLTLTGAGTFSGPVVVSNGTLAVSGSLAGTNNLALLNGTLDVSGNGGIQLGELAVSNGVVNLDAGVVAVADTVFIEGSEWAAGVYTSNNCAKITGDGLLVVGAQPGQWSNGGNDDNWSTADNWVAGLIPNSTWAADLSAAVSNAMPVRTLSLDITAITNKQVVLNSGVSDAVLTNTCPDGVTNTLYLASGGMIDVGEGETLVLDHNLCLMGSIHKSGLGTLVLRRGTYALPALVTVSSAIYIHVDGGTVINEGPMTNVLVSVGKLLNTDAGPTPEFIMADTPEASISGTSFITTINSTSTAPGPGLFTQNGGTVNPGISWENRVVLAHTAAIVGIPGTGTYHLVNGTLIVEHTMSFGKDGGSAYGHYGIFKQSGGTADIAYLRGTAGEVHLMGGLFSVNRIEWEVASGVTFNLGGGRLEPKGVLLVNISGPTVFSGINGDMTFAPEIGRTVRLQGVSSGPGGFIKEGAGALILNSTHAFEGAAQINAGTCSVTTAGSVIQCTNLLVGADAALTLERSGAALNSNLWLRVTSDGRINLDFEGEVEVGHLVLNGAERPGLGKRYGSSSCTSELDYVKDDVFSGTGVLKVVGPRGPDGTLIIMR